MTTKQRKALLRAAELIATGHCHCICHALFYADPDVLLCHIPGAELLNNKRVYWWGDLFEDNDLPYSEENIGARLIGIAMMLTMPPSILRGECHPEFKKQKR